MRTTRSNPRPTTRLIPLQDSLIGVGSLLAPGAGFVLALAFASGRSGIPKILDVSTHPWELWVIGVCGVAATACGFLDWRYHVTGRRRVGRRERHGELIALAIGGVPTFALMLAASISDRPERFLLPIIGTVLFTTAMICYDEFVFHRGACARYETALHRTLVFGNGLAWAAWMHWIFVRG